VPWWKRHRGIGLSEVVAAEDLLRTEARVTFRHALVRSAAYRYSEADRRSMHRALAEATDAESDPDGPAWHWAQAASGPDADVAAELGRSAGRAQAPGGMAASAAFVERATALSFGRSSRGWRALVAVQANQLAGAPKAALLMLAVAETGPLDDLQRVQGDLLRAHIAHLGRGSDTPGVLLKAAARLEPLGPRTCSGPFRRAGS
jgi:hypothetical protein